MYDSCLIQHIQGTNLLLFQSWKWNWQFWRLNSSSRALFSTSMIMGGRRIARTFTDFAGQPAQAFDIWCHCIKPSLLFDDRSGYCALGRLRFPHSRLWEKCMAIRMAPTHSRYFYPQSDPKKANKCFPARKLRSFTAKKTKNGEASWCLVFQKLHVAMVPWCAMMFHVYFGGLFH